MKNLTAGAYFWIVSRKEKKESQLFLTFSAELSALKAQFTRSSEWHLSSPPPEPQIWICKPTSSNQGRGIFLLKNEAEVNSLQVKLHNVEEDPMYQKLPYKTPPARIVQR